MFVLAFTDVFVSRGLPDFLFYHFSRNRSQGGFIDLSQESYNFKKNPVQVSNYWMPSLSQLLFREIF